MVIILQHNNSHTVGGFSEYSFIFALLYPHPDNISTVICSGPLWYVKIVSCFHSKRYDIWQLSPKTSDLFWTEASHITPQKLKSVIIS